MKHFIGFLMSALLFGFISIGCSSDDNGGVTEGLPAQLPPGTRVSWKGYYSQWNSEKQYSEGSSYSENWFEVLDEHYIKASWSSIDGNFRYQREDENTARLIFNVFQNVSGTRRAFAYDCTLTDVGGNEYEMTGTKMVIGSSTLNYELHCTCIITLP